MRNVVRKWWVWSGIIFFSLSALATSRDVAPETQLSVGLTAKYRKFLGLDQYTTSQDAISKVRIAILDKGFGFDPNTESKDKVKRFLPDSVEVIDKYPKTRIPGKVAPLTSDGHGLWVAQTIWAISGIDPKDYSKGPQFFLLNAVDKMNFVRAIRWIKENQIDIVVCAQIYESLGNFDGKGPINAEVSSLLKDGRIIWVNAVGDYHGHVYTGPIDVRDGLVWFGEKPYLRIRSRLDNLSANIVMSWNSFSDNLNGGTDKDLDMYLVRPKTPQVRLYSFDKSGDSILDSKLNPSVRLKNAIIIDASQQFVYDPKRRVEKLSSGDVVYYPVKGKGIKDSKGAVILQDATNVLVTFAVDPTDNKGKHWLIDLDAPLNPDSTFPKTVLDGALVVAEDGSARMESAPAAAGALSRVEVLKDSNVFVEYSRALTYDPVAMTLKEPDGKVDLTLKDKVVIAYTGEVLMDPSEHVYTVIGKGEKKQVAAAVNRQVKNRGAGAPTAKSELMETHLAREGFDNTSDFTEFRLKRNEPNEYYYLVVRPKNGDFVKETDKITVTAVAERAFGKDLETEEIGESLEMPEATPNSGHEVFVPADNPYVFAAGDRTRISSIGPTLDGRPKPDLIVRVSDDPRGVDNVLFSDGKSLFGNSFTGAGILPGALAVMKAEDPHLDANRFRELLKKMPKVPSYATASMPLFKVEVADVKQLYPRTFAAIKAQTGIEPDRAGRYLDGRYVVGLPISLAELSPMLWDLGYEKATGRLMKYRSSTLASSWAKDEFYMREGANPVKGYRRVVDGKFGIPSGGIGPAYPWEHMQISASGFVEVRQARRNKDSFLIPVFQLPSMQALKEVDGFTKY